MRRSIGLVLGFALLLSAGESRAQLDPGDGYTTPLLPVQDLSKRIPPGLLPKPAGGLYVWVANSWSEDSKIFVPTNLSNRTAVVRCDMLDDSGAHLGNNEIEIPPGQTKWRSLPFPFRDPVCPFPSGSGWAVVSSPEPLLFDSSRYQRVEAVDCAAPDGPLYACNVAYGGSAGVGGAAR